MNHNTKVMMTSDDVLCLKSLNFAWSTDGHRSLKPVLTNIDLTVKQGEIYGLLGASGCGKTTLLRLILGQLTPTSGTIQLFGRTLKHGQKPKPVTIGYMPQELVLYTEFTTDEMLVYFGRLYKLAPGQITERVESLLQLLNLDQASIRRKPIGQLSGGQRRRVSLAIALLHQPRLLILDEPTVGVDPVLREVIWNHLYELTSTGARGDRGGATVILTTHYIEEARGAHTIGFLRNGHLLVQDSPARLLARHSVSTMEEVFLKLCRRDDFELAVVEAKCCVEKQQNLLAAVAVSTTTLAASSCSELDSGQVESPTPPTSTTTGTLDPNTLMYDVVKHNKNLKTTTFVQQQQQQAKPTIRIKNSFGKNKINPIFWPHLFRRTSLRPSTEDELDSQHVLCWSHLVTLVQKNVRQIMRNSSLLIFFVLLPAIEIALIMVCIGGEIDHIPIAVYNGEQPSSPTDLSVMFLDSVPDHAFDVTHYPSELEALEAVKAKHADALLLFNSHFSAALKSRFFTLAFDSGDDQSMNSSNNFTSIWNESSVYVRLDMSNQLIGLQIQRQLMKTFLTFAQRLASNMGFNNQTFRPPVTFGPPVYGIQSSTVVETFIAPGALIMIAFFATTIVSCHLLIHEIRQTLIERALIAGVSHAEFLFSHLIVQSTILLVQLALMLTTAFHLFRMPYLGSLPLSIALVTLQGLCGLMYGLMLSATCPDEIYATTLAIGTFFPSVIIGGIFWPVQSMPRLLQYVSQCMPSTKSIDALRAILLRDWQLTNGTVASAFFISTFWLVVFLLCALTNFKRRTAS